MFKTEPNDWQLSSYLYPSLKCKNSSPCLGSPSIGWKMYIQSYNETAPQHIFSLSTN